MRSACFNASIVAVTRAVLIVDDRPGSPAAAGEFWDAAGYQVVGEATDVLSGVRVARGLSIRRRWWLVLVAVGGVAWILGAEWVSIRHGVPESHLLDALTGL